MVTASMVVVSAGAQSVPKCGEPVVTELVNNIAHDKIMDLVGKLVRKNRQQLQEVQQVVFYAVEGVRTTNTNQTTGAHKCAADLRIVIDNKEHSGERVWELLAADLRLLLGFKERVIPIVYTVENTDDGENIYVSVYGL